MNVGTKKKIVLYGVVIPILAFFGLMLIIGLALTVNDPYETGSGNTLDLNSLSVEELEEHAIDWNYRDMLRDIDSFEDELIIVTGKVTVPTKSYGVFGIELTSGGNLKYSDEDMMFITDTEKNWLMNDRVKVYGVVDGMRTLEVTNFAGVKNTEPVPDLNAVKIECLNC